MGETVTNFLNWMEMLPPLWAYGILLLIAYGENVLPPIPGDLIVVFGGYLAGTGRLDFFVVVLLCTLGGAAGFMTMYAIGYRIGEAVLDPGRLRWLPKNQIESVRAWLRRWGYWIVLLNRFLSGARSVISLTVGMSEMKPGVTAVLATISALIWTLLIGYGGYAVGENWEVIILYLRTYGRIVVGVIVLLAAGLFVRYMIRKNGSAGPAT